MDYNDNDILHHNPKLAGEGRSRSSSVLKPYDFPKFDFDDSLQGHLRFDSLVETEVFLGIQSQEDNQWIEDFSRGSNGMEFDPTPADSCSLSRGNNVWSEATSSESVEMLLKSVGQEEMIPRETVFQDSNIFGDQGTVTKHVEFVSTLDEKNDARIRTSEATLPREEFLTNHPVSEGLVVEQLCEVKDPSQAVVNVESACMSSGNLVDSPANEKGWISTNEGSISHRDKSSNENVKVLNSSDEKFMTSGSQEDSLCFTKTIDHINSDLVLLSDSKISLQVNALDSFNNDKQEKHISAGRGDEDSKISESGVSSSLCLVAESEVLIQQDAVDESLNYARENEEDGRNGLSLTSFQTENQEIEVLPSTRKMDDPFEGHKDGSAVDGIDQHSADLGSSCTPHCANPEKRMDNAVHLAYTGDNDQMEGVPGTTSKNESISAVPLFSVEDNKVPINNDCNDDPNVNRSSDMAVLSPAAEQKQTDNLIGDTRVIPAEPAPDLPTCVVDNSKQVIEENLDYIRAGPTEIKQDMCVTKELDKDLSIVAGTAEAGNISMLKNDQGIQSLDVSREVKESGASAAPDDLTESKQMEPAAIGLSSSDNNPNESANRISPDVDFRTEVDNISKFEATVTDDVNRTSHTENSTVSPQSLETVFEVTSSNSPRIAANNSLDSDQYQAGLGHDGSLKERNNSELVSVKDHELTSKTEGEKEAVQASEVDKASCGSPTIITSSEPSQREKDNQEQARSSDVTEKSVNDIQPSSEDPKRDDTVGDDISFTFKVTALPDTTERESGKCWSPFPIVEQCNTSVQSLKSVEETTPTGKGKTARTTTNKTPRQSARVSEGEHVRGTSKGTSERKGRRSSAKGMTKENAEGNLAKRTNSDITSGKRDKVSNTLLSTSSSSSTCAQPGQMQPCGQIERSDTKVSSAASNPTSTLPDLNGSALSNNSCSPALSRQFFTDSQQVQLRAQIFVYGSLIQGTAPDEACMVSAFGPSDGGRTTWEPVWHAAVERIQNQKPNPSAVETRLHSKSGPRSSDTVVKQNPHSSKLLLSPVSRSSHKGTPAAVLNPIIPLSSPLWSISTPFRDSLPSSGAHKGPVVDSPHSATPVHSYQTPPIRNFVGHASWPSQACFPGPWIATPQTSIFNSTVCFQPVTMTETVKLSPVKEPSGPLVSGVKHLTSSPTVQTVGPGPVYVGVSPLYDPRSVSSTEKHFMEMKPRKRKKIPASDPCQVSLVSETRIEPVVVANVTTISSSPVAVPVSSSPLSDAVLSKSPIDASAGCSYNHFEQRDLKTQKAVSCSKETLTEVDEAKFQAEDAAALAATAVKHSEDLWSQLAKQEDSGLTLEAEAKLASAAGAIAAAASVTKAAAAAAKVAYSAALQAKLMADEAFLSSKTSLIPSDGKSLADQCDVGNATPAFTFKCDNITNPSSSILVAAKEAAKKRIETASAASKQAQNVDAIVKAAELAATAVSQAGTIVAMGEPLPLSELIKAGPEGYWKLARPLCELAEKSTKKNKEQGGTDVSAKMSREVSVEKGRLKALTHRKVRTRQRSSDPSDGNVVVVDGSVESGHNAEQDLGSDKGFEVSESSAVITGSDAAPRTGSLQNEHENEGGLHKGSIKEGSLVEVFKHGDGVKSAWYSANVLQLEDGKAFVCYSELLPEKGSENLCEWVPIEGKGNKAPIIRTAHPSTALESQGTRKRRRAALGDYAWRIGDKVDVWINDCWREGVVAEKNEKNETTLKVHFPAQEETLTVRAWNLRMSRLWADGKWVEWPSSGGHNASEQSDSPQEKRQKVGSPTMPSKGKDKLTNDVDYAPGAPEESKLPLSIRDRVFDIGKTTKEDDKGATRKPLRTGQQKKESRVIFGVPKPTGKKRKFLEVSKHFPANKTDKSGETNESVKFAKYLMPQTATTRGWKAPGRSETKESQTIATRSRALTACRPARTLLKKDDLKSTIAQGGDSVTSHGSDIEDSVAHDEKASAETPLSSLLTTSKKISSVNTKSERLNRGTLVPACGKMSRIEEEKVLGDGSGKSALDVTEPRRSNRRFQPTHRLLEGLQSSMIIPKMSSAGQGR